jgi:hypothetical protein
VLCIHAFDFQVKTTLLKKKAGGKSRELDQTTDILDAEETVKAYCEACKWNLHPKLKVVGYTE